MTILSKRAIEGAMKITLSFQKRIDIVVDAETLEEARGVAETLAQDPGLEGWDTTERWTWDAWVIPLEWKVAKRPPQAKLRNGSLVAPSTLTPGED